MLATLINAGYFLFWLAIARLVVVTEARKRARVMLYEIATDFVHVHVSIAHNCILMDNEHNASTAIKRSAMIKTLMTIGKRRRGCERYYSMFSSSWQFLALHKWRFSSLYPQWHTKMLRILFLEPSPKM